MSKHRRCDARCHNAARAACSCWCGGLFHGAAGARARAAFVASYGAEIPAQSPQLTEPLLHWHQVESSFVAALEAAFDARMGRPELHQVDEKSGAAA